jgi:hypothetical protein
MIHDGIELRMLARTPVTCCAMPEELFAKQQNQ